MALRSNFKSKPGKFTIEDFQESKSCLENSIKLCKEAIKLDISDSESWQGLGTSLLKLYFDFTHDPKDLQKSLSAYNKAVNYMDFNVLEC